jgi:Flp pilus assembly pilin Flp
MATRPRRAGRPDVGAGRARLRVAWGTAPGVAPTVVRAVARGQGIVEYGLILSGSALLALVLLVFFSGTVSAVLDAVGDAIDAAS